MYRDMQKGTTFWVGTNASGKQGRSNLLKINLNHVTNGITIIGPNKIINANTFNKFLNTDSGFITYGVTEDLHLIEQTQTAQCTARW